MAMKAILDAAAYNALPDHFKSEYKQKDGGSDYVLDVVAHGTVELADTGALKSALSQERTNAKNAQQALKKFEGIEDPNAAKEALAKMDEIKNWKLDDKIEAATKAREQQLVALHAKEKTALVEEKTKLLGALEQHLVVAAATSALSGAKGSVDLLLPHVVKQTRMRQLENGTFIAEVVDTTGNARVGDGSGNPMTIPQLVAEMKANDVYARAFESSGASGSGATQTGLPAPDPKGGSGGGSHGAPRTITWDGKQLPQGVTMEQVSTGDVILKRV